MLERRRVVDRAEAIETERPLRRLFGVFAVEHERHECRFVRVRDVDTSLLMDDRTESQGIGGPTPRNAAEILSEGENAHEYLYAARRQRLAP